MPLWVASAVWSSKEEDVIWIIIIVIVVLALLGYFGRGRLKR
jgi:flagellar basal body-associated protein FliL